MRTKFRSSGEKIKTLIDVMPISNITGINNFFLDHEIITWNTTRTETGIPLIVIEYIPTSKEEKKALGVQKG